MTDLLVQLILGSGDSALSLNIEKVSPHSHVDFTLVASYYLPAVSPASFCLCVTRVDLSSRGLEHACLLGSQDAQLQQTLSSVRAIIFFATPHRGSNRAQTLNRFLQVSFQSPKQYVTTCGKAQPE